MKQKVGFVESCVEWEKNVFHFELLVKGGGEV